jgi:hypothetical protein
VFDLLYYHSRWHDIDKDSLPYTEQLYEEKSRFRYKGYYVQYGFGVAEVAADYNYADYPSTAEIGELAEKNLQYLMKIIELTQEKGIGLVLIKTQSERSFDDENEQKLCNAIRRLAENNQIPFFDYNEKEHRDAMGFDFTTDMMDNGGHLNSWGAEKLSKYIATFLKTNYGLPDHRGDPAYSSWDEAAAGYFAYEAAERARMEAEQVEETP